MQALSSHWPYVIGFRICVSQSLHELGLLGQYVLKTFVSYRINALFTYTEVMPGEGVSEGGTIPHGFGGHTQTATWHTYRHCRCTADMMRVPILTYAARGHTEMNPVPVIYVRLYTTFSGPLRDESVLLVHLIVILSN